MPHDGVRRGSGVQKGALGGVLALALLGVACNSSGTAAPASTPATATSAPSIEASVEPSASPATQVALSFQEASASKIFGGGSISDLGDGSSVVTIGIVAVSFTDPLPAELAAGSCTDLIAAPVPSVSALPSAAASEAASAAPSVAAPSSGASAGASTAPASPSESVAPTPATLPVKLADVTGGASSTVVQMTLANLLGSPAAVAIHKSAADLTIVACADVTNTPVPSIGVPTASSSAASPSDMPAVSASPSTAP
jgi:hypothetical protein